jgi:hypothetical protein
VAVAAPNSAARVAAFVKLPDWSGVWRVQGSLVTIDGQPAGKGAAAPYNAEWQKKYAQARKDVAQLRDSYERFCYAGMPRVMASSQDLMFFLTPEETQLHSARHDIRHIWTDGRLHPPSDELWPLFWGESIGQWQEQTLVVKTTSIKGDLWLDATGASLSDQAQITERISLAGKDQLKNEITIVDPVAFTKPWTFTRTYRRTGANDLVEVDCKWTAGSGAKREK